MRHLLNTPRTSTLSSGTSYYIDGLTRAFSGCAERGKLRPGTTPVQAAQATIAAQDGLQLLWLLHGDAIDLPGGIEAHLRRLVVFPAAH